MAFSRRKLIIDCDPGIDDAFALAYAMKQGNIDILGITTVTGNVHVKDGTRNVLIIEDLLGCSIPVYPGEEEPMSGEVPMNEIDNCHGDDGLGDIGLSPSHRKAENKKAVDFILDTLANEEEKTVDIVCLGPLTNLAQALMKNPDIVKRVRAVYSMGGSVLCGNVTPVAEFNYWVDPKAAEIVYQSGLQVHMIGLNPCDSAPLPEDIREKMKSAELPETRLLERMLHNWPGDIVLYDFNAMAAALSPDIVKWLHCRVDISTTRVTRGECVADLVDAWKKEKNCFYAEEIDKHQLWQLFCNTFLPVCKT